MDFIGLSRVMNVDFAIGLASGSYYGLFFIATVLSLVVTIILAKILKQNAVAWSGASILVGPVIVPIILLIIAAVTRGDKSFETADDEYTRPCPHCLKDISVEANFCKFCKKDVLPVFS